MKKRADAIRDRKRESYLASPYRGIRGGLFFTFHSSLIIHFFIHVDYFNEKAKAYALMRFTMARRPLERVGER